MKEERQIKRWIKNKFSYTRALLIAILITGVVGFSATTEEDVEKLKQELATVTKKLEDTQKSLNDFKTSVDRTNKIVGSNINTMQEMLGISGMGLNYKTVTIGDKATTNDKLFAIAIGASAQTTQQVGMAIGYSAITDGQAGMSLGYKSYSSGTAAMALGAQTIAKGQGTIATGYNSKALGNYSIAHGFGAMAGEIITEEEYNKLDEVAKKEYAEYSSGKYYNKASNYTAIAIGLQSEARRQAVSLGTMAKAIGTSSLALGIQSNAVGTSAISLGSFTSATGYNAIAIGTDSKAENYRGVSIGVNATSGTNSVSLGSHTDTSKAEYSVAVGNGATVNGHSGISIGNDAKVDGGSGVAIGAVSKANTWGSVSLGTYSEANRNKLEYGYNPVLDRNISNLDEMYNIIKSKVSQEEYEKIKEKRTEVNKLENETKLAKEEYEKILADANPDNSAENIIKLREIQQKIVNLDNQKQKVIDSIPAAFGTWAPAIGLGEVSVGNGVKTRQITNVAAGSRDNDAVNVAQLKSAVEVTKTLQKATGLTDEDIKNIVEGKEKTLIERIQGSLSSESKGALAGVASAMAMSSIPQVIDKENPIAVGGAVSLYKGEAAFALGVSGVNKKGNIIFKASSAINTKLDLGASFGLSYSIGNIYSNDGLKLETEDKSEIVNYVNKVENDLKEYKAQTDKNMQLANKKIEDLEKKLEAVLKNQSNNNPIIQQVITTTTTSTKEISESIKNIVNEKVYVVSGFVTNDYKVSETDKQQLRNLVTILNENIESATIDVVGHTDVRGGFEYNLDLGLRRAKEIVGLLKSYGLKPEIRIRNITSGGLIAPVSNVYAGNRRVEIHFDNIEIK